MTQTPIKTVCPRDCYDGCGVEVNVDNGAIRRVAGNRDHPNNRGPLCGKCLAAYNGAWIDPKSRLLYPMRRSGPKGSGQFTRIGWEEALTEIATRLKAISSEKGADKIYHTHYTGTCSKVAISFPERFFKALGATEVDPDSVCNRAGHLALDYVLGSSVNGIDPRTIKDSECVIVWGANPSHSAPHVHKMWLRDTVAKVVVIDPVRTETAEQADIHLQLLPGSDASLAFAIAHVMQRDNLLDDDFIANHVVGYDELKDTIAECSPTWAETKTGLSAAAIEEVASLYAKGPSILWLGQALQRQPKGGNIFRACSMLPAFSGNIGKPGTGLYYLNGTVGIAARKGGSPTRSYSPGDQPEPIVSQMDLPKILQDSEAVSSYMVWNCNPVASNPAQADMRAGLARDDLFTVVVDPFMTDTADYADIVLPAATFLEFDDLATSYFHLNLSPQVKCAEPLGESLPNPEIFRRLAKAMDFDDPELFEDDRAIIDQILDTMDVQMSFEELKAKGWTTFSAEPLVIWSDRRFPTPSGKIEIASRRAQSHGLPLVPSPQSDPLPADGRLRLLSPADKHLMNSSYGNDDQIQRRLIVATVTIHPDDATDRNISAGDTVMLSNANGELEFIAKVDTTVPKGSLLTYKSRWPKAEGARANVNLLHIPRKTDIGESTSVHGVEVELRRA